MIGNILAATALLPSALSRTTKPFLSGAGIIGGGAVFAAKKAHTAIMNGTSLTNPVFANHAPIAYGKRGIDSDRMNVSGLVQSLHENRRKF